MNCIVKDNIQQAKTKNIYTPRIIPVFHMLESGSPIGWLASIEGKEQNIYLYFSLSSVEITDKKKKKNCCINRILPFSSFYCIIFFFYFAQKLLKQYKMSKME